jgi:iron(III) transport system substrate-binding protein
VKRLLSLVVAMLALGVAACGSEDSSSESSSSAAQEITVYSGRSEKLVGALYKQFEQRTGIKVKARYGDSAELAATLGEEGSNSPADVFFSQDAGALGAVEQAGLLAPLPQASLDRVDARWRDPRGFWVGSSGRSRVVAYSTERLKKNQLPDSIFDFTDPKWKGRIGFAPPNASFQAFLSAMRIDVGDERTRKWLEGVKRNEPTLLENNIQTVEAIASGEIDAGFVNHYYLYELRAERGELPVANHFLAKGDPGALVNVAGAGILKSGDAEPARRFVEFLLSDEAQRYFAEKTFEYPLVESVAPPEGLPALKSLQGPDIKLGDLGGKLESTLKMLDDTGLGT